MQKDNIHQEPEEKVNPTIDGDAKVVPHDEDMLTSEPKIHREHASVNTTGPTVGEFRPPPFTGKLEEDDQEKKEPPKPEDHPLANPGVKNAPPHVKEQGVAFLADKLIRGYGAVKKKLACWAVLISPKTVDKLEQQGLVNRNMPLPLAGGGFIMAGAMIDQHNDESEKLIDQHALSQEFYDEVKPMVEEELSKRNIALTNVQMLIGAVGIDAYTFIEQVVIPLRGQGNEILDAFKNASKHYQNAPAGFTSAYAQATSQQASGNTPPPPPPAADAQAWVAPEPDLPPPPPIVPTGGIDTAFEDLQNGGSEFMKVQGVTNLPGEFAQVEAMNKALRQKRVKAPRKPYKKRVRNKKQATTIIHQ